VPKLAPYAGYMTRWFAGAVGGLGLLFLQFLLIVVITAILFARGERAAASVIRFAHRLAGDRGETTARLAGQAIRSVALGVVVTAIAQSLLGGIGLAVVGIPFGDRADRGDVHFVPRPDRPRLGAHSRGGLDVLVR
jgi:predicted PurR-regulated permease PerM